MEQQAKKNLIQIDRKIIYSITIAVLLLGIFFRFANLDTKVYWGDETVTSLRISGYTLAELQQKAHSGEEISITNIKKYQYPNQEKSWLDTIKGLAVEEPQHPPFYFLIVKFWVKCFGDSVAVTRSFSALVSLLALPCIYWLCQELFNSPLTGFMAVALVAISPFHVLYAQEARSYSLWTVTILLSSAALLRAMRLKKLSSWLLYSLTLAVALYTYLLSGIVVVGHGIYVLAVEGFFLSKTVRKYLLASFVGISLFLPWIITVLLSFSEADTTTSWTKLSVPLKSLVKTWMLNCSRIFVDFNYNFVYQNLFFYLVIIATIVLSIYSIYFLVRQTQKQIWLFILTLVAVTAIPLAIPDLIWGGIRSSVARYLIPCYLGIEITIAYLLAQKISQKNRKKQFWQMTALALILGGIISCSISSQATIWWNKYNAIHLPQVAQVINQSQQPLVITSWHYLMAFSHILNPQTIIQIWGRESVLTNNSKFLETAISDRYDSIFVQNSAEAVDALLQQELNYKIDKIYEWKDKIEPVYETKTKLWKLTKIKS